MKYRKGVKGICRCGAEVRPGQRNCRKCRNESMKRTRQRRKAVLGQLRAAAGRTDGPDDPETRQLFEQRVGTKAIVVPQDGQNDLTGFVIGFFPGRMLKVMDDFGCIHVVALEKVEADRTRIPYGRAETPSILAAHP